MWLRNPRVSIVLEGPNTITSAEEIVRVPVNYLRRMMTGVCWNQSDSWRRSRGGKAKSPFLLVLLLCLLRVEILFLSGPLIGRKEISAIRSIGRSRSERWVKSTSSCISGFSAISVKWLSIGRLKQASPWLRGKNYPCPVKAKFLLHICCGVNKRMNWYMAAATIFLLVNLHIHLLYFIQLIFWFILIFCYHNDPNVQSFDIVLVRWWNNH